MSTQPSSAPGENPQSNGETVAAVARRSILVVDDHRDAAKSLGMLLELQGAMVQIAFDGLAALAALEARLPEIVLLDLDMPEMDGYEVARRIREQPKFRAVILIALTGWSQDEELKRCEEVGFDRHMVKPVTREALQAMLASF